MAHQTTDGLPENTEASRLLTYVQVRVKHVGAWEVASALLEGLARGAFEHAQAATIESVKIEAADRILTVTGQEAAVREVSEFIKRADETVGDAQSTEEAPADADEGWTDDPLVLTAPPITNTEDLRADFWPEDESVDDFLDMVRDMRSARRSRTIE